MFFSENSQNFASYSYSRESKRMLEYYSITKAGVNSFVNKYMVLFLAPECTNNSHIYQYDEINYTKQTCIKILTNGSWSAHLHTTNYKTCSVGTTIENLYISQ